MTYAETLERCKNFGSGLIKLGLPVGSGTRIGIFATNSIDYLVAEFASYNHSMVVVPLYDTLGPSAVRLILNQADIECVLCDTEDRLRALITESDHLSKLKLIVLIGDVSESYKSKAVGYGIKVHTMDQVEQMGKQNPADVQVCITQVICMNDSQTDFLLCDQEPKPADLAVICYTSGTTGPPKGVMLTHENVIANLSSVMYQLVC
jgi:long-chain acyl-CoA synthetase